MELKIDHIKTIMRASIGMFEVLARISWRSEPTR